MPEQILFTNESMIEVALALNSSLKPLKFSSPVYQVYLPTDYAWERHCEYLTRFANSKKRVLFLGMNPGPWGMTQTGIPFGEITSVRDWMGISGPVNKPNLEHPKRPIEGFNCTRSEVSGKRLWGLFSKKFPCPDDFFTEHFVANFCPLVWMGETGKNITPDKIAKAEMCPVEQACQYHLAHVIEILQPTYLIGVGGYAEKKFNETVKTYFPKKDFQIGKILHPSPASPIANRGWAPQAEKQLLDMGIWE